MSVDLSSFQRIVIKVGSSLLVDDDGRIDRSWLDGLASDVAFLRQREAEVLVVSSGAIAIGSRFLKINKARARLEQLQAAAAVGQVELAHAYKEVFSDKGIGTAQILLTLDDTEGRRRFLNARSTLRCLLDDRIVPVINENDTVATDEIRYGDNDRLAARVAQMVMADALILLSDVDGLYTSDPGRDATATHIAEVGDIDDEIVAMAGETKSDIGSGGMATKVQAARIATHAGCSTIIASGRNDQPIHALAAGGRSTVFAASETPAAARKQWLAGMLSVKGELRLDDGAVKALKSGNSLLPVGIVGVVGEFRRGDVLTLVSSSGQEIGRGLAEYSDTEARQLIGLKSDAIEERLGYRGRSVIVHRDELLLF
ncbi:MAG: glutamate 5-kinase [Woeseiaceae bacterium]|nr:glutamate 5-kinase [Woeseiaceae bacterium]